MVVACRSGCVGLVGWLLVDGYSLACGAMFHSRITSGRRGEVGVAVTYFPVTKVELPRLAVGASDMLSRMFRARRGMLGSACCCLLNAVLHALRAGGQ